MTRKVFRWGFAPLAITLFLVTAAGQVGSGQQNGGTVAIDNDDIGGVVTGPRGPEAGVWVIAETTDLPTRLIRIVVTDEQGRYVVPDLPKANYDVWVRGYGLVDSTKTKSAPGKIVNLTAVPAPNPRAAAEYYPALYWFALMQVPPPSDFPGTGPSGNGIATTMRTQGEWIRSTLNTDGCTGCHQLGGKATREIPKALGAFPSSVHAWERRLQSGQAGAAMLNRFNQVGKQRALSMYADWTDRIAGGEYPTAAPPRPQGRERNVVVTMWDWADPKHYLHDEIASDKRNPFVNANGPVYGALEASADYLPVVDPKGHSASTVKLQVRDPKTPSEADTPPAASSPYWADEVIWTSQSNAHSFAMDKQARVWIAARIRPNQTAEFCRQGSEHPSAKAFPLAQSGRQMQLWDPKAKKITTIDTCFGTHHLNFDNNDVLWFTGGGQVEGWFDTRVFDKTGDEKQAQGWTAFVLDTNGNGKRDAYVEPDQPVDPTKDKRISAGFYGVAPEPNGNAIWGTTLGMPGAVVRLTLGSNPPATALTEYYEVPFKDREGLGLRLRAARHGRRQQWGCLDHAVERTARELRPPQVQGTAERAERHWEAVPGGLDLLRVSRTELQGRGRLGERRRGLLQLRRSVRHARLGQGHLARHRQRIRFAARSRRWQVADASRPLSDGLLRQGDRRAHRRPARGVEGQGRLLVGFDPRAVPHGNGQGDGFEAREVAGQAEPAIEVIRTWGGFRAAKDTADPPITLLGRVPLCTGTP